MLTMTNGYVAWVLTLAIVGPTVLLAWGIFWIAQVRVQAHETRRAKIAADVAHDRMIQARSDEAIARMSINE